MSDQAAIDPMSVQSILARHLPMYKVKVPTYQSVMLEKLREVWDGPHDRLLDVGGGTGVIAQVMAELFPVKHVHAVDLVDRFCPGLTIKTTQYDGWNLPFAEKSFDAVTLNNVLHHVPAAERADLLREIRRVVDGPLYIKDHIKRGLVDGLRLTTLDAIGNVPFDGMVKASYLSLQDWQTLAQESGWQIGATAQQADYRTGFYSAIFPNRLEMTVRFDPA